MKAFRIVCAVTLGPLVLGPVSCSSSSPSSTGQACTDVGCAGTLDWRLDLPVSLETLRQSTITVCRNADCFTGDFASLGTPGPAGTGVGVQMPDPTTRQASESALATVTIWTETNGFSLQIAWTPWVMGDATDGDAYTMELHGSSGALLSQASTTVSAYEVSEPNGPVCGPICRFKVVDVRASP